MSENKLQILPNNLEAAEKFKSIEAQCEEQMTKTKTLEGEFEIYNSKIDNFFRRKRGAGRPKRRVGGKNRVQ